MTATQTTATTTRLRARALRDLALGAMGGLSFLALAACGGPPPQAGAPPPPTASQTPPPPAPDLLGGPPEPPAPAAPAPAAQRLFFEMAPVANPADMTPSERIEVYGHRYDYLDHGGARPAHGRHHHGHHHARHGHAGAAALAGHHARRATAAGAAAARPAAPAPKHNPPVAPMLAPTATESEGAAGSGAAPNSFSADWLSLPGAPTLDVPGFGKVASKTVVAIGLLLLALAIMILAVRGAPARKPRSAAAHRPIDLGAGIAATPPAAKANTPPPAEGDGKAP
jgi:hypothetical protein